jgi:hypothetical protein
MVNGLNLSGRGFVPSKMYYAFYYITGKGNDDTFEGTKPLPDKLKILRNKDVCYGSSGKLTGKAGKKLEKHEKIRRSA